MLLVWLTGAAVASQGGWFGRLRLWAKLIFVIGLTGWHGVQSGRLRRLLRGDPPPARLPAVDVTAMIAIAVAIIAVLAVVKPS